MELVEQGLQRDIPKGVPQVRMEAAHIIPFSLKDFDETARRRPELVRSTLYFFASHVTVFCSRQKDAARTWDMLHCWAQFDIEKLAGTNINDPINAIYMTSNDHDSFGRFHFYLDKDAVGRLLDDPVPLLLIFFY
jgi:hypothetical protein